jgi:hypothetical protein
MEHQYLRDAAGNLTGPTLQAAVFAGTVDPGNLVNVREIVPAPASDAASIDTAVFAGPRSNYAISVNPGAGTTLPSLTVNQTGAVVAPQKVSDGIDTLRNIEQLQFTDGTVSVSSLTTPIKAPAAPAIGTATAGNATATARWTAPANGGSPITSYTLQVRTGPTVVRTITGVVPTAVSNVVTALTNGTAYNFRVQAVNAIGTGPLSASSNVVTPAAPATAPATPAIGTATGGNANATARWTAPATGGSPITSYRFQVLTGATVVRTITGIAPTAVSNVVTALTNGTAYNFRVQAVNAIGTGPLSAASNAVTPATVPNAPAIGAATAGTTGGAINATARWTPNANTGGAPITGYRVQALRLNAAGAVLATTNSAVQPATARSMSMALPVAGNYRFTVQAINRVESSAVSLRSNLVAGR